MNRISFKGFFLGMLLSIVLASGAVLLAYFILGVEGYSSYLDYLESDDTFLPEVFAFLLVAIWGYVAARIAKRHEVLNSVLPMLVPISLSVVAVLFGLYENFGELLSWIIFDALQVTVAISVGFYAKKQNKKAASGVKNVDVYFLWQAFGLYLGLAFFLVFGPYDNLTLGSISKAWSSMSTSKQWLYGLLLVSSILKGLEKLYSLLDKAGKSSEGESIEKEPADQENKTNTEIDSPSCNVLQASSNECVRAETIEIQINRDGKIYGPYPVEVAREYLEQGSLSPDDSANISGMPSWERLDEVLKGVPA